MRRGRLCVLLAIALLAIASGCSRLSAGLGTEVEPHIRISSERIPRHWKLEVHGTGFTPTHNISSHLRRSDGSEFPVLPILTDTRGEFTHTIDTMILELGRTSCGSSTIDPAAPRTTSSSRSRSTTSTLESGIGNREW